VGERLSDNLKLWQSVEKTDPKYTKAFTKGGGFSGTAINATYLIRKATELWGPMGSTWGPEVVDDKYVPGGDGTIIHVLRINLRYPQGSVPSFGQTTFVGTNKNGMFTDEEAPKKSLTDATTKALSWLGFSADVFLGLYDDNKYVNDRKQEFSSRITPVSGALALLSKEDQQKAKDAAAEIVDLWTNGKELAAYEACYQQGYSNEMMLGIWDVLTPNSEIRNKLKKMDKNPELRKAA
jgi:hypothetical protein